MRSGKLLTLLTYSNLLFKHGQRLTECLQCLLFHLYVLQSQVKFKKMKNNVLKCLK